MTHLITGWGYPLEEHFVTTADGFVLGVYRIPHGRTEAAGSRGGTSGGGAGTSAGGSSSSEGSVGSGGEPVRHSSVGSVRRALSDSDGAGPSAADGAAAARPPVLLWHGLLDSSAAWVLNEPDESLGFILADAGYDVWMANTRGNLFSRNHTGLDPGQPAFWDFSWDDMAAYDMPAVVNYVLKQTGASQLAYVGHSQGTTQAFAALASSPALRRRLSLAVMLAPAVHMGNIRRLPFEILAALDADRIFNWLGPMEFLPSTKAAADLFGALCQETPLTCASVITAVCGFNPDNFNLTRLPTMVQYAPSGTSVKTIAQWAQAIRRSRQQRRPLFQMYDYGSMCSLPSGRPRTCNMRVYHSLEPPSYDLGAITSPPLAIFHGGLDKLADPGDVATLLLALPQGAVVYEQLEPTYQHLDLTWGIDARQRIYPAVLQLLARFPPV
ncbi:lysosomal acid lipase cholesteryl ester hydrolase [Micractinium conductrix]|uniref:Lipase n=1 Tax=Micractinium conductrix TaxID=554055 RepID=A0A2P6V8F3_9CHLO|nr:lysosomal acid lipase cholesteryl ester hydrolase [Micractinium conductrix]|eukprot:PSC70369.1 lysosomal acid lipase cholesteryl ester hydrolase [Micractinium conductrix]